MTDEELDALVFELDHAHPDDIDYRACSTSITTLRAQLAEARAKERQWIEKMVNAETRADRSEAALAMAVKAAEFGIEMAKVNNLPRTAEKIASVLAEIKGERNERDHDTPNRR